MHAIDFLRDPSKIPGKPVYAVFGDDAFLRRESLLTIEQQALAGEDDDLAVARFAGDHAALADVLDDLRTLPFFTKRRVAIVDNADPFVTAHRKELEAYVEHPAPTGVLVLSVKTWPANTKLAKQVERVGMAVECKGPHERTLIPWLVHLARSRFGVLFEDDAVRLLVELVGPEVGLLVSEVEKLSVYVGARARIHHDDVARMVGAGHIEDVWHVLGAATTGRANLAIELLDRLLAAGEQPVGVLAAMSTSLRKVHYAGRLRRERIDLAQACQQAGIPSFAVEATRAQHAHLGPKRVDQLPRLLLQADLDIKGASMLTPAVVLETLLVQLSRPRDD